MNCYNVNLPVNNPNDGISIWNFERVALLRTMNRLAVYSYLTRYPYGHARCGRLFTEPLPENRY